MRESILVQRAARTTQMWSQARQQGQKHRDEGGAPHSAILRQMRPDAAT